MSVIESFYFLFQADSSNLKKGLDESRQSSDKLAVNITSVDDAAKKMGESFATAAKSIGATVAGYFALGAIKHLTEETADHTYEVYQQAKAIGVSTEMLSTWQHAVMMSGGTAEGATRSIEGLRDKFVEMSRFPGMMSGEVFMFQKLGLSAKDMHDSIKDPMIAMEKLAVTFGKLNNTQQLFVGKKLGFDMGTIALLSKGRQGFDEMIAKQKELGSVTEKEALTTAKFKLQQTELGIVFETVSRQVTGQLLPAFTWISEKVEKLTLWVKDHKTFVAAGIGAIAVAVTAAYLPAILSAATATGVFVGELLLVAAPFLAIGGIVALVVDDFVAFQNGQDSLIGDMLKKWPIIGDVFKSVGEIAQMSLDLILIGIAKLKPVVQSVSAVLSPVFEGWINTFKLLFDIISEVFVLFLKAPIGLINTIGSALATATGGHYDEIGSTLSTQVIQSVGNANRAIAQTNSPISTMNSSYIQNSIIGAGKSQTIQIGDVTIQTAATDSKDIAASFGDNLKMHMKAAQDHFDDGVAF